MLICAFILNRLEHIQDQLHQQNVDDIKFIIVNSHLQHAMDNVGELSRRVSFPVYQDTRRNNIWGRLGGNKDDILIYDRYHCFFPGLLTPNLTYIWSYLGSTAT
jgi:hypothetical protein